MKALVTGGGGFLGGAVVRQLVKRGDTVRSFSRGDYPSLKELGVEQKRGDLSDPQAVSDAMKGCDIVLHVGAKPGYWGPYEDYYQANVVGTKNIIEACKKNGIRRLVYTSSPSVVFSGGEMEGVDESLPYPDHFLAAYPETKAIAEKMVLDSNGNDLATVALRPHLIWGPGDNHLIPRIVAKSRAGRLRLIGDGSNLIDTVFVDNAAKAHLLAADKLEPGSPIAGKAYFISNGEPKPLKEIYQHLIDAIGLRPLKRSVPKKLAYIGAFLLENIYKLLRIKSEPLVTRFLAEELATSHWFDISAARRDLGYRPEEIPFGEGMRRLKEHIRRTGEFDVKPKK